jgi:tetratricopeptide (TPR) repeat protein
MEPSMAKKEKDQRTHEDIFMKITRKIEYYIIKHIKIIAISLSVLAILLAAYFTTDYVLKKSERKALSAFERVYLAYTEVNVKKGLSEKEIDAELLGLVEDFKIVIDEYRKSKAAAKSALYIGDILYRNGKYEEAVQYFEEGSSIKRNYYVSLLSLQSLASSYVQLEKYEKAIEVYNQIENRFNEEYIIPTVLFFRAQLFERINRIEKADDEYSRIVTEYPWSGWKEFAEKRLLLLKSYM